MGHLFTDDNTKELLKLKIPPEGLWLMLLYEDAPHNIALCITQFVQDAEQKQRDIVAMYTYQYPSQQLLPTKNPFGRRSSKLFTCDVVGYEIQWLLTQAGHRVIAFEEACSVAKSLLYSEGINIPMQPGDSGARQRMIQNTEEKRIARAWRNWNEGREVEWQYEAPTFDYAPLH